MTRDAAARPRFGTGLGDSFDKRTAGVAPR